MGKKGKRQSATPRSRSKSGNSKNQLLMAVVGLLAVAVVWSYWPVIADLWKEWQRNDDYSAGQLVPLVACIFVWRDRKKLAQTPIKPCWPGLGLLVMAMAAWMFGLVFMFESAERYSLVLTVAALTLLVAGWRVFVRAGWILLFLFLMVPFPGKVHNMISGPLQRIATNGAVFLMEASFLQVSQQGNVVTLGDDTPMAVAEACSGLRMLVAFIIVSAFIAYMIKRSRVKKAVLLASSIPIAVIGNIVRLYVTGVLMMLVSTEAGEKFFHDFAGLAMMPVAVILIFGEIYIMDRLTVPDTEPEDREGGIIRARSRDRSTAESGA